jgi:hypothetical protein
MNVDDVVQELTTMDFGTGAMAFMCYVLSLRDEPRLELTTDGFMICFGRLNGLHIFKYHDSIFCRMIHEDQRQVFVIAEQEKADELYERVLAQLLEEVAAA